MSTRHMYAFIGDGGLRVTKIATSEELARAAILRDTSCTDLELTGFSDVEPYVRPEPRKHIAKTASPKSGTRRPAKSTAASITESVVNNLHHDVVSE